MSTRSLSLVLPDIWQLGCGWCEPGPHEECWSNAAWPFLRPYSHGDGCRGKACCASLHERMLLSLSVRFICQSIPNAFGWIFQVFPSSDEIEKKEGREFLLSTYILSIHNYFCAGICFIRCVWCHTHSTHSQWLVYSCYAVKWCSPGCPEGRSSYGHRAKGQTFVIPFLWLSQGHAVIMQPTHRQTHTRTHARIDRCTYTHACIYFHTHSCSLTQVHTKTKHTHTQIHIHKQHAIYD